MPGPLAHAESHAVPGSAPVPDLALRRSGAAGPGGWLAGALAPGRPALLLVGVLGLCAIAAAGAPAPELPGGADPRGTVSAFLELTRQGRYGEASRLLHLPPGPSASSAELARELKLVLDHSGWIALERLSNTPTGDLADGLAPGVDEVTRIRVPGGQHEPVQVERIGDRWLFSAATTARIPAWFEGLPNHWVLSRLPDLLLRPGPRELLLWQWLAAALLVGGALFLGSVLSVVSRKVLASFARRTRATWDDALVAGLAGPLTVLFAALLFYLGLPLLELYPPAMGFAHSVLHVVAMVGLLWAALRSVNVVGAGVLGSEWAKGYPGSRTLVPLGARTATVAVGVIGLIAVLSQLGYPVASLLAGLGIGGLAIALAAQKTVENLFGAYSIGLDQPFREGDFVKIEDFVGTVERIGLRSTRIRTLDRTIITLPNSKVADMRLETFAARDRIRLAATVGLVYSTTADQMRAVLAGLEQALRAHPKIWPDAVVVRFKELGPYSLDIEVMAWFLTSDWGEFQRIREELLLHFMEVVQGAGTSFAFPTQTLQLQRG